MDRTGHILRAVDATSGELVVGVVRNHGFAPLRNVTRISQLLELELAQIESELSETDQSIPLHRFRILPPIDGAMEVWAAGVTYMASREARVEESGDKDVYQRVYHAERPELFFKGTAWRMVTDGEPIGIRDDSPNDVPEPEVGLVVSSRGELVGFTIIDDVSSRAIEGANPLYLPQAKVYDGSCAVGPSIVPRWLIPKATDMRIEMTITRDENVVFSGESSTGQLKRGFEELTRFLFLQLSFPEGVILATGTSVVPPLTTTLSQRDLVEIEVDYLGRLVTPVAPAEGVGQWLTRRRSDPTAVFDHAM